MTDDSDTSGGGARSFARKLRQQQLF